MGSFRGGGPHGSFRGARRTRIGNPMSPRRNLNPPERRQRLALFALVLALALGLVAGAIALAPGHVKVPDLRGLSAAQVTRRLTRAGLRAELSCAPSVTVAPGVEVSQAPGAHASVRSGTTVQVVTASTPRWREVTSLSGQTAGRSVAFRVRGRRWRLVYSMSYQGTCTFVFFCSGPSARVIALRSGQTVDGFDLSDGSSQIRELRRRSGPLPGQGAAGFGHRRLAHQRA